jgi:Methyltransferase domain/C-methyltransferase C-terminal domain
MIRHEACPICDGDSLRLGMVCRGVPAHTVVLHHSRESAVVAPCGDIALTACEACGFVFNAAYDPSLHHYSDGYESTQSFSETFTAFNETIAAEIADQTGNVDGPLVEVGCGQGEFLALLKERGCDLLVGFDPAYDAARSTVAGRPGIEVFARTFDGDLVAGAPRAVICKMTLEHIAKPVAMLKQIAELASRSRQCGIFVQVPNAGAIFSLGGFWDIYYEHCNYFTVNTLSHALRRAGLEPVTITPAFTDQYILAYARHAAGCGNVAAALEVQSELTRFERFCGAAARQCEEWRDKIRRWTTAGEQIMLWGAGSKAVAFVSFTHAEGHLLAAIDINPRKSNTFLPGSGVPVLSPNQAKTCEGTIIILLNPVYRAEVARECSRLGIDASIVALGGSECIYAVGS